MRADPVGGSVEHGPHLQVHGLQASEGALDRAQALVRAHGALGVEFARGQAGAHDVQAVQRRLRGDGLGLSPIAERVLFDIQLEVLGHLVFADDLAHPHADLVRALQAPLLPPRGRHDGIEQRLGGPEQLFPARPLLRQQRIAAHHEALARIGVASDLHQVGLVEQRQLHRAGFHQRPHRRTPQRADPVQAGRAHVLADARLGQHPAVAHQHHPGEPEPMPQLVDLRAHGGRVRGVAVEHLPPAGPRRRTTARTRSAACRACRRASSRAWPADSGALPDTEVRS